MWSYMRHFLARWRSERSTISERASEMITVFGEAIYYEACKRAWASQRRSDAADARVWSKVAREIRKRRRMVTCMNDYDWSDGKPSTTVKGPF